MGVQLEPVSQGSFEQYGPWHFRDTRFQQDQRVDLSAAFLRAAALPVLNDLCEASKARRTNDVSQGRVDKSSTQRSPQPVYQGSPPSSSASTISAPPATASKEIHHEAKPLTPPRDLAVIRFVPLVEKVVLSFPLPKLPGHPRPNLKRRRPETDVDGFNTASLSCKKRRLRRDLITSRLSQPFSLPATHILNREVVASGDKRFLKLAAIMATRRLQPQPIPPLPTDPSSLLRRQAVFNRYRLRMCAEAAVRGVIHGAAVAPRTIVPHSHQPNPGMGMFPMGSSRHLPVVVVAGPSAAQARDAEGSRPPPPTGSSTLSPAAAPVSSSRLRITSPRLRPLRSPELRVTRPSVALDDLEDLDDDGVAFPTSEHESRYEDEPDDVYADFGLIFGGGDGDGSDDEGAAEQFEDYMDDLDGIPWNARC
ncbi:hypothetical protein QBC35DRAFT_475203 [Podospora australis]|uniref:Uncharacterized protein n=1 Tax=Podospora australis TaxID=1536484 RepID=A0AAN6WQZ5_9PEZI|nr:hypothetical protein QBC35DRAFT_475203 [Podospora australis]